MTKATLPRSWSDGLVSSLPLAVVVTAPVPFLILYAQQLWLRPHYQFFPVVLGGAAFLAWEPIRTMHGLRPGANGFYRVGIGAAGGLLTLAVLFWSPWLTAVAAWLTVVALLFGWGGWELLRRFLPALAFLLLAISPPLALDTRLIGQLQTATARCSSPVLDLLGVYHVPAGNVVEVSDRQLLVEEACSGMQSLLPVLAGTCFFALWTRMSLPRAVWLLGVAVCVTVPMNVVRVVSVVLLNEYAHIDVATGWRHELLGLLLFGVTLGLLASADRLWVFGQLVLSRATTSLAGSTPDFQGTRPGESLASPVWRPGWGVALLYAALGLAQLVILGTSRAEAPSVERVPLAAEALPAQWARWQRVGFERRERATGLLTGSPNSEVWHYRLAEHPATVSLDYPFHEGWHELPLCYQSQGWVLEQRRVVPLDANKGPSAGAMVVVAMRKMDQYGMLWFLCTDASLRPLEPAAAPGLMHRATSFLGARQLLAGSSGRGATRSVYQLQLFMTSYVTFTTSEEEEGEAFFRFARQHLTGLLLGESP